MTSTGLRLSQHWSQTASAPASGWADGGVSVCWFQPLCDHTHFLVQPGAGLLAVGLPSSESHVWLLPAAQWWDRQLLHGRPGRLHVPAGGGALQVRGGRGRVPAPG